MFQVPVFRAEREAGLEQSIRSAASVAYASALRLSAGGSLSEKAAAYLRSMERAQASVGDLDLHYLESVLATTGWNNNDDVFDPLEAWVARRTPEHKQLNYVHDCSQIVGHITSCWVMGEDGKAVADDTVIDDLPARFHLVTGGVLYKYWEKPELQERMDTLLAEIAKGEWFVSMECLFKGFDYALKAADGTCRVVARNEQNAFLTKHLRAYGGTGKYGEYTVGRLLRNILFSGKGLVRNPANPESVIFADTKAFAASRAVLVTDFARLSAGEVYSPVEEKSSQLETESHPPMAAELETLQKQLEGLKAENEQLKAAAHQNDVKASREAAEKAKAEKAKADELLKAAQEALAAAKAEADAARAKLAETEQSLAEVKGELAGLYKDQRVKDRVTAAKEKLKLSDEDAAKFVATNEALTDEQYTGQVDVLAKAMTAWVTNNPQSGNTSFPSGTAQQAPKGTPAPNPPKATSAPAPMAGKMVEKLNASEQDQAGEQAAAGTDLESAQAQGDAALSTVSADGGVSEVQKAIAAYFGADAEGGQE